MGDTGADKLDIYRERPLSVRLTEFPPGSRCCSTPPMATDGAHLEYRSPVRI